MPELTFTIGENGLIVPVVLGLNGETMTDLLRQGLPIPMPIQCHAAIDTGDSASLPRKGGE